MPKRYNDYSDDELLNMPQDEYDRLVAEEDKDKPLLPAVSDTSRVSEGASQVSEAGGGFGDDILSALGSAAEFVGDVPVPFLGKQEITPEGKLGDVVGMQMRDLPSVPGKMLGDVWEMGKGFHQVVNPYAGEEDEGGLIDTASALYDAVAGKKDEETGERTGGVGIGGVAQEAFKVPLAMFEGDVEAVGEAFKEDPLISLLDLAPQAALATGGARAGSFLRKGVDLARQQKQKMIGEGVTGRLARGSAGLTSGVHSGPLEVVQNRAFTAVRDKVGSVFEKEAAGFDSIENIADVSRQVADEIYRKIPKEANREWKKGFAGLALKNADDPISFADMRTRMFTVLREKYGIDATGFAAGETKLNFKHADAEIRDNARLQEQVNELVARMDGIHQRYKGLRLSVDTRIKSKRKVKTGREKTYTAQDMHEELSSLRKSAYDKTGTVDFTESDRVIDDVITIFRRELGKKLDGFDEIQKARSQVFRQTDAMIEAFGFKQRKRKFQPEVPDESTTSSVSRLEQLLASKPSHKAKRQIVQTFQNFVEERFGRKIDIEKAVAEIRIDEFNIQGISRAGVGGSPLGLLGLAFGDSLTGAVVGQMIGSMTLGNPKFNGLAFKVLGASDGLVNAITDRMKQLRQSVRENIGTKDHAFSGIVRTPDAIDALTITELLNRSRERSGDFLTTLGGSNGDDQ